MLVPGKQNKVKFNKTSTNDYILNLKYGYLTVQNWHEKPPDWNDDDV